MNRFVRQENLAGFGTIGQQALREASVLVVGAGGLGCPALSYLCAAGVGTIGIIDGDVIEWSNLNRQILFGVQQVGQSKALSAVQLLQEKYPDITLRGYFEWLTNVSALSLIASFDLVVDGSDNFPTRYLVNDACTLLKKPLVTGAIHQHEGQLMVFAPPEPGLQYINYRDVFPQAPGAFEIPNCEQTGVIGALPGAIGTLLAMEAIKWLSGYGVPLLNKLLVYDGRNSSMTQFAIVPHPESQKFLPATLSEFLAKDYGGKCLTDLKVEWKTALSIMAYEPHCSVLVDIRESHEMPDSTGLDCLKLPVDSLLQSFESLAPYDHVFLFCQSGQRSLVVADKLQQGVRGKKIYSIIGGALHEDAPFDQKKQP